MDLYESNVVVLTYCISHCLNLQYFVHVFQFAEPSNYLLGLLGSTLEMCVCVFYVKELEVQKLNFLTKAGLIAVSCPSTCKGMV